MMQRMTRPVRLHALLPHLAPSPCTSVPVRWNSCVRIVQRRMSSSTPPPQVLSQGVRHPPDLISEPEMVRRLMRSHRVWWWMGGILLGSLGLVAFGPELKLGMSNHTADVAARSLQNETLRDHSRALASQIVQTVLNDPKVLAQASQFLQRLVVMESTRDALQTLVLHVLSDSMTRSQVLDLAKQTVATVLADPTTLRHVVELLQATTVDPQAQNALFGLVEQIMRDETTRTNVTHVLTHTFMHDHVQETLVKTLGDSVHQVLSQCDVQNHAKAFVTRVLQDETVQNEGGDAIWGTLLYALTPTWLAWVWAHPKAITTDHSTLTPVQVATVLAVPQDEIKQTKQGQAANLKDTVHPSPERKIDQSNV